MSILDRLLLDPSVRAALEPLVSRVAAHMLATPDAPLAWESVPLKIYGNKLPDFIRSSWVFILRGGQASGAERHPNSHQRVASYRGDGDLQIQVGGVWQSHRLSDDTALPIERRWASIPHNVWHQAVVAGNDWVVVSFHSVEDFELIEERPNEARVDSTARRKYLR